MKYVFRAKTTNKNYPLCIFYKVKTFSEYWYKEVGPMYMAWDGEMYWYNVYVDVTNWTNSNGGVEHNDLTCVGDGTGNVNDLPMVVYAFQKKNDPAFDWLDEPVYQHNPESYAGWEEFKATQNVTEETLFLTPRELPKVYSADILVNKIRRVAFVDITPTGEYDGQDDITINFKMNYYNTLTPSDPSDLISSETISNVHFTRVSGNVFKSDTVDINIPSAAVFTTSEFTLNGIQTEFTEFTTEIPYDLIHLKPKNTPLEVLFNGNRINYVDGDSNPWTCNIYGCKGYDNVTSYGVLVNSVEISPDVNCCQVLSPTTKTFSVNAINTTFNLAPIITYIGVNGYTTREIDIFNGETSVSIYQSDDLGTVYSELNYFGS